MSDPDLPADLPAKLTVPRELDGERLDRALDALVPELTRAQLQKLVRRGRVRLRGRIVHRSNLVVRKSDALELAHERPHGAPAPAPTARVLHVDEHVVVVDKPTGLLVHPTKRLTPDTLSAQIARSHGPLPLEMGDNRPGIVHRLDRETSGVMLVARSDHGMTHLRQQFRARTIKKRYIALAHGVLEPPTGTIDLALAPDLRHSDRQMVSRRGKPARTDYEVLESFGGALSLVACRPTTGRRHQIRVHLAHRKAQVAGDRLYGAPATLVPTAIDPPRMPRHALHAQRIEFRHPADDQPVAFEAPLPPDFEEALSWLRSWQAAGCEGL